MRRRRVAHVAVRVHAHAGAGGFLVGGQGTGAARDDAGLDRETAGCADGLLVGEPQGLEAHARRDAELRLDEIDAGDLFRDRVFHLDARVAFDEVVVAGLGRDQELHRAGIDVAGSLDQLHGVGVDSRTQAGVQTGGGRCLDDLLVAQLHRAVAFVQVHGIAGLIGENLHLDVPRAFDELFHEQRAVAERRLGFAATALERVGHRLPVRDRAHAATAAPGRGLEHDRIADFLRERRCRAARRERFAASRDRWDAKRLRQRPGLHLVPEQFKRCWRRADEGDATLGTKGRVRRVLGEEPVAWVYAVASGFLGNLDEGFSVQVGRDWILGRAVAELPGLGGQPGVQRQRIDRCVDANRLHAEA